MKKQEEGERKKEGREGEKQRKHRGFRDKNKENGDWELREREKNEGI